MAYWKFLSGFFVLFTTSCTHAAVLHRRDCSFTWPAYEGDSCATLADSWSITEAQLVSFNPGIVCDALEVGREYCVEWTGTPPPLPSTTQVQTSSATSSTAVPPVVTPTPSVTAAPTCPFTPTGVTTPSPIQTGLVCGCTKFYKVISGDNCWAIANTNNIALTELYEWNPVLGTDCKNLFPDNYICISKGQKTTTTTAPPAAPTSTGPFVPWICTFDPAKGEYICPTSPPPTATKPPQPPPPGPTQTGVATNCNKWVLQKTGVFCYDMAAAAKITLARLYTLNPALGGDCSGLWPGYAYCIGTA